MMPAVEAAAEADARGEADVMQSRWLLLMFRAIVLLLCVIVRPKCLCLKIRASIMK